MAKRLNPIIRFTRALFPIAVGLLTVIVGFESWIVYRVTHPVRTAFSITPSHYQIFTGDSMAWSEEQWDNSDGTKASGWFLRGVTGSPAVILNHGYGKNRSELLNLGVKLCEAGYHVLLPDLRGHGKSPVNYSSLGVSEKNDVSSAVNFVKAKKNAQGQLLADGSRVGLYGVSIGGYAAITATTENPTVKVVIADSLYPKPDWLTHQLVQDTFKMSPAIVNQFAHWGLQVYFSGTYGEGSAAESLSRFKDQKLWLITYPSSNSELEELNKTTLDLFQQAQFPKEIARLDKSRAELSDAYDDRIIAIFRKDLAR
jgi:pimeloyl-ACP methyl ester carboxylesterase